ncbi:MAG: Flagellar hook-associated protein 1 [Phycisphaerales bacterium]|nr:Flagellar hook-associated protein 1 [Phycisphaerales bacterium]
MTLIGALNIGQSALAVQQAALQVTGNNISNAGNADYTRQTAVTVPGSDQQMAPGIFIGSGINLTAIQRQIDESLENRIRSSGSDTQSANTAQQWLSRVESTFNALGANNLSSQMSSFSKSWSALANNPQDSGLRQTVLQSGDGLARTFTDTRGALDGTQGDLQARLAAQAKAADGLAQQVATLNGNIINAEGGSSGQANSLRDQRDAILKQLSQLVDIKTVSQDNGTVNVYVGSEPLVVGTSNQGVAVQQQVVNGQPVSSVVFKSNNGPIPVRSGEIGALATAQSQVTSVTAQLDTLAHNLIFELNKLHSSGQGLGGLSTVTASNAVTDPAAALTAPAAGLAFTPTNGSFVLSVRQKSTGLMTSTLVPVHLTGAAGDTTLNSLAASLNAINGVTATITGGRLKIAAATSAIDINFSQDSSGTLATLGINTFFTGKDSLDMAVNQTIQSDTTLIAAAKNGEKTDNQTALAIAALQSQTLTTLNGTSLTDSYQSIVNGIAGQVATATTSADAAKAIHDTLTAQRSAISGVSMDEEAINLVRQQNAFQGAAKLITTVNAMMQTILNMLP